MRSIARHERFLNCFDTSASVNYLNRLSNCLDKLSNYLNRPSNYFNSSNYSRIEKTFINENTTTNCSNKYYSKAEINVEITNSNKINIY